ncbi:MAG: methylmalonyl Co-A mutase-associated GTPase MeaB [Verrucomicrobiota bacterium]
MITAIPLPSMSAPQNTPPDGKPSDPFWEALPNTSIVPGVARDSGEAPVPSPAPPTRRPRAKDYIEGVLAGNRAMLARAITLIESAAPGQAALAQEVLTALLPHAGKARRIGISGVPGVGKSTFIEALGQRLCGEGHRVAVLAVDPSSTRTRGSVLGDKTRMEQLSREANAFIRPSPSGGVLGGVAQRTRESVLLCEAAGFDVVIVETVGTGQSETAVRSMVDFFLLLLLPGGGDELQGIKKGIVELADALLINKAEEPHRLRALETRNHYAAAQRYLRAENPHWQPQIALCSALADEGIGECWEMIGHFYETMATDGRLETMRAEQKRQWLHELLRAELIERFYQDPARREAIAACDRGLAEGELTVREALARLLEDSPHPNPKLNPDPSC